MDTLLQDYNSGSMKSSGNRYKKIAYNYDLISGKVNSVVYQPGQVDAFYHQYTYDADNRLTEVSTSNDSIYWENDAAYDYYRHGPLARLLLGQNQVQGIDYAYTLQGWLKGVNSTSVNDGTFDMGADGKTGSANANVARDAYGFSLNYYNGDYKPIGSSVTPFATTSIASDLFNGNIKSMALNIPVLGDALTFGYRYDQLNRLVKVDAYNGLNNTTNVWTPVNINDYKESLSYDPNGNIKTYLRNGTGSSLNLNNYNYTYTPNTNQLANIYNSVNSQTKTYNYDAIGNTTVDGMQGTTNGVWNVYGKLQSLTNKDGQSVTYTYSADGQRISKKVGTTEEWYVRDAAGNNLATYTKDATINSGNLTVTEQYKYGSSLLDVKDAKINVENPVANDGFTAFERGDDNYILADGNGNTKATISDKKIQHSTDGTTVDYYNPDVRTATLHSSFGANAKTYNGGFTAANFNGQRKSLEIGADAQTAQFWEYDGDVGRRWNTDNRLITGLSPYSAFLNNPIIFTDQFGDTTINGQKMEGINAASATYLPEVIVKAKKKYVPEQDFAHNPLTGYNSKTGSAYTISNTATVESLSKDFLLNWQGSNGRRRNTIIVGGPLLEQVKNMETVERLFIQGLNDLNNKKFKPGSYFKGFYQMSNLNGKDGDLMKTEVLEDLLNGKSFTDSRFFSAQFFLGSFDFSMRVTNDGKYIAITVYDSKSVRSLTDGGSKFLHKILPLQGTLPTYQRYLWAIPIEKVKEKYTEAAESLYKKIK